MEKQPENEDYGSPVVSEYRESGIIIVRHLADGRVVRRLDDAARERALEAGRRALRRMKVSGGAKVDIFDPAGNGK